jgi:hypothetical protein
LTPVDETKLEVIEIESAYTDHQVVTAFWSDDGRSVHYAFASAIGVKPLHWAVYDVATHVKTNVSSPLKFDDQIWRRLNVPVPLDNSSLYPEIQGYLASSGEHIIFTVDRGSRFAVPADPNPVTEIWLADSTGQHKTKLLELSQGMLSQAVWLKNETRVIFDFGGDGGVRLYIADVQNGTVAPLSDVSDFKRGTEQHWAVSPDGSTLAIVDLRGTLWLVSLEDGKSRAVEKYTRGPTWSKDGKNVFYWWGETYNDTHILRAYEVATGDISVVLDQSSLVSSFNGLRPSDFAVSADGSRILFWGGGFWLVELHK